jgi:hypothetical protein
VKKPIVVIVLLCLLVIMSGCGETKVSNDWVVSELAGIENPGFDIVSKNVTKNGISFVLADIDIEMVNQFLEDLYGNTEFTINVNYNYSTDSYSYAAFNDQNESIHFTYNLFDKSGYFIYAKSGDALFIPGVRDMGYSVTAEYDYLSNIDYTLYTASLYYNIMLKIQFTNSTEYLESFVLRDFEFKSLSSLGTLTFRSTPYGNPIEDFTKTGSSVYELNFFVFQQGVGQYPATTPYGHTSTFFDVMEIGQSSLDFVVTLTADIVTSSGSYTHDYEIRVMPAGSDVTEMDRYMTAVFMVKTINEGIPFTKLD